MTIMLSPTTLGHRKAELHELQKDEWSEYASCPPETSWTGGSEDIAVYGLLNAKA
jgi:hypothetical protein